MVVRELVATLGLEVDERSFAVAEKVMTAVHAGAVAVVAAAGAAATALAAAVAKTAEYADQVEKAAQRTGIGVESLQALQYAAERADISTDGLQAALNFMARKGVKDFEAELRRAADELAAMPDGAAKAARAIQLFGKQGAALIPMLNEGSAGLDEMTRKAREMGIVLGEDAVEEGAALKDTLEDLQGYIRGVAVTVAGPLLKPVREWLGRLAEWVRANRQLIAQRIEQVVTLMAKGMGYLLRMIEPVVDILWDLGKSLASASPPMKALAAAGLMLAAGWSAPVTAIGLFLMALEEVWGWVTGKRDTLLEEALGPYDKFMSMLDVDNPEDNGLVRAAKAIARALRDVYEVAMRVRVALGLNELHDSEYWRHATGQDLSPHDQVKRLFDSANAFRSAGDNETYAKQRRMAFELADRLGVDPTSIYPPAFSQPTWTAPAAAVGPQTTIGTITVHAPPGSTAQDVVDLIRQQIGIERRSEYVSALPAVQR